MDITITKEGYLAPRTEELDICVEGVVCASNYETEELPGFTF